MAWFAVRFHCEQVLKSRPDDASAKKLLETAHGDEQGHSGSTPKSAASNDE